MIEPQDTLELAKQGDAQAIASLINRQLQSKGITAKVTINNSYLQIILESNQSLNQQALVEFLFKGLTKLKITSITRAKILGNKIGESFPSWSEELYFTQSKVESSSQASKNDLKEQARLGDTNAILFFLNQSLQPKNITATIKLEEHCLNVILESDDVPKETTAILVRREITMLNSKLIKIIRIYARQCNSDFPAWSKEINLSEQNYSTELITDLPSANSYSSINLNNKIINLNDIENLKTGTIFVIVGSIVLALGAFAPIVSAPVIGNLNYFNNGNGDGVILVLLSVVSILLVLKREYKYLWWTGITSIIVTLIGFFNLQSRIFQVKSQIEEKLADNPFKDIADITVNSIQLQWGWVIILLGITLILIGAYFHEKYSINKLGYQTYFLNLFNFKKANKAHIFAGLLILSVIIMPKLFGELERHLKQQALVHEMREIDGKMFISSINNGQAVMFLEKNKFASTLEELKTEEEQLSRSIESETDNYSYNITAVDSSQAIATASAKKDGIKSYTGAVFLVKKNQDDFQTPITIICETNTPSKQPPSNPQLVGENIQCPTDSIKVN